MDIEVKRIIQGIKFEPSQEGIDLSWDALHQKQNDLGRMLAGLESASKQPLNPTEKQGLSDQIKNTKSDLDMLKSFDNDPGNHSVNPLSKKSLEQLKEELASVDKKLSPGNKNSESTVESLKAYQKDIQEHISYKEEQIKEKARMALLPKGPSKESAPISDKPAKAAKNAGPERVKGSSAEALKERYNKLLLEYAGPNAAPEPIFTDTPKVDKTLHDLVLKYTGPDAATESLLQKASPEEIADIYTKLAPLYEGPDVANSQDASLKFSKIKDAYLKHLFQK